MSAALFAETQSGARGSLKPGTRPSPLKAYRSRQAEAISRCALPRI
jgi:hypothetical protein